MNDLLEQLFYGNLCPNTDCRSKRPEVNDLTGYITDHHDTLLGTLTDAQKEIFEKYDDCITELTDMYERDLFSYAFRLGVRLTLASLLDLKE